jgi:hypothetical protein
MSIVCTLRMIAVDVYAYIGCLNYFIVTLPRGTADCSTTCKYGIRIHMAIDGIEIFKC